MSECRRAELWAADDGTSAAHEYRSATAVAGPCEGASAALGLVFDRSRRSLSEPCAEFRHTGPKGVDAMVAPRASVFEPRL